MPQGALPPAWRAAKGETSRPNFGHLCPPVGVADALSPPSRPAAPACGRCAPFTTLDNSHGLSARTMAFSAKGFVKSMVMIGANEVGDKTFFIAAVMAMTQPRSAVFGGALAALALMTALSAMLGYMVGELSGSFGAGFTDLVAALLFFWFGARMLWDAHNASGELEELKEVEEELAAGAGAGKGKGKGKGGATAASGLAALCGAVFTKALTLTFLAEWGDRSQLATITLAARSDPLGVTLGGIAGHAACTGLAVIGGRAFASAISERVVLAAGGALFWVFGVQCALTALAEGKG